MKSPRTNHHPTKLRQLAVNETDLDLLLRAARRALAHWATRSDDVALVEVLAGIDDARDTMPAPIHRALRARVHAAVSKRADHTKLVIWAEARVEPPDFVWRDPLPASCPPLPRHRPPRDRRRTKLLRGLEHETGPPQPCRPHNRREADDALLGMCAQHPVVEPAAHFGFISLIPTAPQRDEAPVDIDIDLDIDQRFKLYDEAAAHELARTAKSRFGKDTGLAIEETIRRLKKRGTYRSLAGPLSDEALARLARDFPHAEQVLRHLRESSALARLVEGSGLSLRPTLLAGDPGIGKTAFVQAVGRELGVPFRRIDGAGLSTAAELIGLSTAWGNSRTGIVFNSLCDFDSASPTIFVDELDKVQGNDQAPVMPALLALLEPETARIFHDESLDLPFDASRILWFAAANNVRGLPDYVLSRFNVFHLPRPTELQTIPIARSIYRTLCSRHAWGRLFPADLNDALAETLARYLPREISRMLEIAFGRAALDGRTHLKVADIGTLPPALPRVGF